MDSRDIQRHRIIGSVLKLYADEEVINS
jgi:hypothetical protein